LLLSKRNSADSEDNPETISWQALGNETENVLGQRIDSPRSFGVVFDSDPQFKEICSFGPEGIKLKTQSEEYNGSRGHQTNTVSQAAKRATNKRIG